MTEKDHVEQLSRRLGLPGIEEDQFVQSHTPFRDLVPILKDKNILVLGGVGNKICEVAKNTGSTMSSFPLTFTSRIRGSTPLPR